MAQLVWMPSPSSDARDESNDQDIRVLAEMPATAAGLGGAATPEAAMGFGAGLAVALGLGAVAPGSVAGVLGLEAGEPGLAGGVIFKEKKSFYFRPQPQSSTNSYGADEFTMLEHC